MTDKTHIKKYRFSGHQTFVFRYGWLEKGVRAVGEDPGIFGQEDAIVRLGVGKNMVESIRHWCDTTQLIEEVPKAKKDTGRPLRVSEVARKIFLNGAWDPFMENDASLWLVHWLLVSNPNLGTSWQLIFGHFHRPDFSKRELVDFVKSFAEKHSIRVQDSSLTRDIDCFLRTYLPLRSNPQKQVAEETFDCPLQELALIHAAPDGEFYRFAIGPKPSLPAPVFAFAFDQYFSRIKKGLNTMGIQECLYGVGSPGQAFKLDENALIDYIEEIEDLTKGQITLDETAGLKQIYRRQQFDAMKLLEHYYAPAKGKRA